MHPRACGHLCKQMGGHTVWFRAKPGSGPTWWQNIKNSNQYSKDLNAAASSRMEPNMAKTVLNLAIFERNRMPLTALRADETDLAAMPSSRSAAKKVLFVTSELTGLLKSGGLGEISSYLPRMLRRQGLDARILIPGYQSILAKYPQLESATVLPGLAEIPRCGIAKLQTDDGLLLYIVLCDELYNREGSPYGDADGQEFSDNDVRFARLGLAAQQIVAGSADLNWKPDVVHVNDWPSAMAPAYMAWRGTSAPSIMTVHNLAYQGLFERHRCRALGIPDAAFQTDGVEFHGKMSFLKAGLFYASHLTTVSPTYACEILTAELGCGLDGLLRTRAEKGQLTGILNGIDDSYDPQSDPHLQHHFGRHDLAGKQSNAADVRDAFKLTNTTGPLFALVSRLVHQKGVDLVVDAAHEILQAGGALVATGQGEPHLEAAMTQLAARHPGSVGVRIGFDETIARRMYAGSDFLLMPSRFEPCGLSQMYAQRFGSLPIAHKTGGLADTIQDNVTGFLFDKPSAANLGRTIRRAVRAFAAGRVIDRMKDAAMQRPSGWADAAGGYRDVYARALAIGGTV
jgi:starch synthase